MIEIVVFVGVCLGVGFVAGVMVQGSTARRDARRRNGR